MPTLNKTHIGDGCYQYDADAIAAINAELAVNPKQTVSEDTTNSDRIDIERYSKVRFVTRDRQQATAALILSESQQRTMTITSISALFPMSEAPKMEIFERGPWFPTWEQAFAH